MIRHKILGSSFRMSDEHQFLRLFMSSKSGLMFYLLLQAARYTNPGRTIRPSPGVPYSLSLSILTNMNGGFIIQRSPAFLSEGLLACFKVIETIGI